jgi:hypothetical protein
MIFRRSFAYSSMIRRASSNRDDLVVAVSPLSRNCSSRGFIVAMVGRDQKRPLI